MTPVVQTETELGRGNCLAACVASLLNLNISDVPNFRLFDDQWGKLQEWLGARGMVAIRFPASTEIVMMPPTHCILTGNSPRNPVLHAVIGKWIYGDLEIVHDPHPDGTGLDGSPKWITFFANLT